MSKQAIIASVPEIKEVHSRNLASRPGRVNALLEITNGKRYLEIGVQKGKTFHRVEAGLKVGVDPRFLFDAAEYRREGVDLWEMTSDAFFASVAHGYDSFDVVYIDGLHTFEQVFRDLISSLSYCHANTVILIDDTIPVNIASFQKSPKDAKALRHELGIKNPAWMGDVCKVIVAIKEFMPGWSYATFPGHGQTALVKRGRQIFNPSINSLEAISRLSYMDILALKDEGAFNILETDEQVMLHIRDLLVTGPG